MLLARDTPKYKTLERLATKGKRSPTRNTLTQTKLEQPHQCHMVQQKFHEYKDNL